MSDVNERLETPADEMIIRLLVLLWKDSLLPLVDFYVLLLLLVF